MSKDSISKGDKIKFGHMVYNCGTSKTVPLNWNVIDIKDGTALVLFDKLLIDLPFHEVEGDINWEGCSLRHWLNHDFLYTCFTPDEINMIAATELPGESGATDRVFILSKQEIDAYLGDETIRDRGGMTIIPSRIAYKFFTCEEKNDDYWWTRSVAGFDSRFGTMVCNVAAGGFYGRTPSYCKRWVRPACRINLEKLNTLISEE